MYPGVSEKTVQRIMQKLGWQCKIKVKRRKKTDPPAYIADNLLASDFTATKPLERLVTYSKGCILHSDQGLVYMSYAYQKAVKDKGITMSMSRKGTPDDNSPIETFHSTLMSETFCLEDIYHMTNARVINIAEEYIIYYNNTKQPIAGSIPSIGCVKGCFILSQKR